MKDTNEFVKIHYKDEKITAYLTVKGEMRKIELFLEDSKYKEELIHGDRSSKYICEKTNGTFISLFNCYFVSSINSATVEYRIGIIVEEYVENILSLNFKKISAFYPNIDKMFGANLEDSLSTIIKFKDRDINFICERIETLEHDKFNVVKSSGLVITLESLNQSLNIELSNELFYRINCLFSFICNTFISYQYQGYYPNENYFEVKIYQDNEYTGNKLDSWNTNYGVIRNFGKGELEKLLRPINSKIFQVWQLYTATLRVNMLLEHQFLEYMRCLEIIAASKTSTYIYDEDELRAKSKEYKELVNNLELDLNYKNNLKNLFKYSNKKSFKPILLELLSKQPWFHRINRKNSKITAKDVVREMVDLRDYLTHGNELESLNSRSLNYYCSLIKEILIAIILNEHNFDYEYELKKYEHAPITNMMRLLKIYFEIEQPIKKFE